MLVEVIPRGKHLLLILPGVCFRALVSNSWLKYMKNQKTSLNISRRWLIAVKGYFPFSHGERAVYWHLCIFKLPRK